MTLYCPMCAGQLHRQTGMVITLEHGIPSVSWEDYVVCELCPLVSTVSKDSGKLLDLGVLTLEDVDTPFGPGDHIPPMIQDRSPLLMRRES